MAENSGIQNFGSVVDGPQAAGSSASAEQTVHRAGAAAPGNAAAAAASGTASAGLSAHDRRRPGRGVDPDHCGRTAGRGRAQTRRSGLGRGYP
jgi:hypothetical protein